MTDIYYIKQTIYYTLVSYKRNGRGMAMNNSVRKYRTLKGLTQKELANAIGVTRQTIALIEKGTYNPTMKLAIAIATQLDTDLNSLFWRQDTDETNY